MERAETTHIIIHTAALTGDPSVSDIRDIHVEQNGWDDIGYHYVIRKNGKVEHGRSELSQGAHCKNLNMNARSIGICLSGNHELEYLQDQQLDSLTNLCISLMSFYKIPLENVLGHHETGANTPCPGKNIDMDWLRNRIKSSSSHLSYKSA